MFNEAIEEFGKRLVDLVRDSAMWQCDNVPKLDGTGAGMERLRAAAAAAGGQVPAEIIIPECVDITLYEVLHAMDSDYHLHLSYTMKSGETVDLAKEGRGELAAQYMASDGWRAKYSKERLGENVADPSSG